MYIAQTVHIPVRHNIDCDLVCFSPVLYAALPIDRLSN
jgi:hypothetical protein